MSEPTLAEIMDMLRAMNTKITALESEAASRKGKSESSSGGGDDHRYTGGRDHDFHPKPKKWDFPRYDGTTDPMLFLNKCDAYFLQHRTTVDEKVRIASYHLDEVAQLWFTQVQEDDGTPNWAHFKELLNVRFGPPRRCSSSPSVDAPGPWRNTPIGSRLFFPAPAASRRHSECSSSPGD
jgi:hypothetical protein